MLFHHSNFKCFSLHFCHQFILYFIWFSGWKNETTTTVDRKKYFVCSVGKIDLVCVFLSFLLICYNNELLNRWTCARIQIDLVFLCNETPTTNQNKTFWIYLRCLAVTVLKRRPHHVSSIVFPIFFLGFENNSLIFTVIWHRYINT